MTTISGSTNVSILDSHIIADLCAGKFYIDVTPTQYINGGADLVLGAKIQIKNPAGIIIRPYGGYDISPAFSGGMDVGIEFGIPTQAGNYQYGKYTIDVTMVDADGTVLTVDSKTVNICEPDPNNKTRKYGTLGATIKGVCKEGKVYVSIDNIPNYRGKIMEDSVNTIVMEYPTGSGLPPISTSLLTFSVQLFEGDYLLTGTICASYNFGDNVYVNVPYRIKVRKDVKCIIDECCVAAELRALQLRMDGQCSQNEREGIRQKILDTLYYLKMAQLTADCGDDPSDFISRMEDILDCPCTCNCNEGVPIINNAPSKDFVIEGCNVIKQTVGLTDHYTIENYEYTVTADNALGVVSITAPTLADCTKKQVITYNAAEAYKQLKYQVSTLDEFNFWANIVGLTLNVVDASCLGYTPDQWKDLSFSEKIAAIIAQACSGGDCDSAIKTATVTQVGSAAKFDWTQDSTKTPAYTIDIFIDGSLKGTVLGTVSTFTVPDMADAENHDYILIPRCENGTVGSPYSGTFGFLNCPTIAPPNVSSNNVNGVSCPFDLTTLLAAASPPSISSQTEGLLSIGQEYTILNYVSGDDFTNVANVIEGTINTDGCIFIATGTTPTDWSNGSTLTFV